MLYVLYFHTQFETILPHMDEWEFSSQRKNAAAMFVCVSDSFNITFFFILAPSQSNVRGYH